jgi:hypothetical protein
MNVLFFHILTSFCCFGLLWLLTVRSQFWPFTDVLREIRPAVTQKVGEIVEADYADVADEVSRQKQKQRKKTKDKQFMWERPLFSLRRGSSSGAQQASPPCL